MADDEALIFTTDPRGAPYHAVLIANHWWITLDGDRHSASFNTSQARPNADGTYSFVIAPRDPAAPNWLDTAGLHTGIVQARWQGLPADVSALPDAITDVRLVKLADLKSHMRPETAWLTPAERRVQSAARHAAYCLRLSPP